MKKAYRVYFWIEDDVFTSDKIFENLDEVNDYKKKVEKIMGFKPEWNVGVMYAQNPKA